MFMPSCSQMDELRQCLVCSVQITSTHLGMDICRACAAFFKRAKITGAQYPCRQGTFDCCVSCMSKFTCRRCRFDKCVLVGLSYDGPLRLRVKPVQSILERISKEFKSMISRRRARELEIIMACENRIKVPAKEPVYVVAVSTSVGLFDIAFSESHLFFENAFPTLQKLTKQEQEIIFKDYMVKLALVLSYYLTIKFFGNINTKLMSSVCTCFDREMPLDFFYPGNVGNKKFFESSVRTHTDEHISLFVPQLNRCQLTEKEFNALVGIVLTEVEPSLSEEAEQLIDEIRQEIFQDLQSYYQKEMGLADFSVRLGHLMSLNHTYQECRSLHKVLIRYYTTFFDVYLTEKYMEAIELMR
ncbi:hypothetical protein PRIPAC_80110 [Pristionchus pacificus]|nr:hypothetical protein PRIPAC_80110 [Pristionchus pacificus]